MCGTKLYPPRPLWFSQEQPDFYISACLKSVKDIFPDTYRQVPKDITGIFDS